MSEDAQRTGAEDENVLGTHTDMPIDESALRPIPIQAGDVSVHSSRLVHGSGPNKSSRWRRGLTVSYMPATMRVVAPHPRKHDHTGEGGHMYPYLYLLRGNGVAGVNDGSARSFEWNPRPVFEEGVHMPFEGCEAYMEDVEAGEGGAQLAGGRAAKL